MVKFRCQRCSQKIAVNTEGIGVVIACPTCSERLVVPPHDDVEFTGDAPVVTELLPPRPAVAPNLARLLMDRLVQALLSQRRDLMAGQADAAEQIAAIEQRLALVQSKLQRRLAYYEEEMAGLREELAAKETENRALRQQLQSRPPLPFGAPPRVKRATLNAELLLRS